MSNARCLTEGVDVPLVDAIAFIDPKKSIIDIVQATGRAMRKAKGKEKGYIFVPVIIGEEADPEKHLDSSDFKTVWQVLQAMVDHDQHIQDVISRLRILQGMRDASSKEWNAAATEYREKVEFFNLPSKVDQDRFIEALTTKTIEVIARQWDFWFDLTIRYKEQYGVANAPPNYKTPEGFSLGAWQSYQRQHFKRGKLEQDRIKKLEEIGFVWNWLEESFDKGFEETLRYKELSGNANAPRRYKTPEGFRLGSWQGQQRGGYRSGTLEQDRIKKLEDIGFAWEDSLEELFQDSKYMSALKEGRCYICGTHSGEQIKVLDNIYIIEIKQINLLPICTICYDYLPEKKDNLDTDHLVWETLAKRLNQYKMYSRTCKNCGTPILSAIKSKAFCSNNCRSKYWQRQSKME